MNDFGKGFLIDIHPYAAGVLEYPSFWLGDNTNDLTTNVSQTPDDTSALYTPYANPDLSWIYSSESAWSADRLAPPSVTFTSGCWQNDAHFPSASFVHPLPSGAAKQFSSLSIPCEPPMRAGVTPTTAWENPIPYMTQESHPVLEHISGQTIPSSAQSTTARARHTPYPLSRDAAEQDSLSPSLSLCQWTDCGRPCGMPVAGTKKAIAKHMQTVHGIRLKADTTSLVCRWGRCGKSMRKESIARHALAVHLRDKVYCPSCRSHFARPDSLQRHRRTCVAKFQGESTSEVCEVGGEIRSS